MNVNNRKMFKPRPARNKLNSMGGIMSSSPELIDTVARFQQGGSIYANQPSMITSIRDFLNTGDAQSGVGQIQEQNAMIRAGITPEDLQRVRAATAANQIADSVEAAQATPIPVGNLTSNISNISSQLSDIGALMSPQQVAGSEARRSQLQEAESRQLLDGIFASPLQAPGADVFAMPGVTPSPEPALAPERPAVVEPVPAPQQEDLPAEAPEVVNAAKRGELGPEAQVKAVVQQGTPEEQQQELSRLMAEFTQNAPEFGGADRGLAIAKIGFAMAAGQSPNAITNIASALSEGADALIKDKRERDAFDRQVQLSALQYGLGEIGKKRAEDRLAEREGRKLTYWVADSDGSYNGQTFEKGQTVAIPTSYILENGIPEGLGSVEMAKAALETNEALQKALLQAQKDNRLKASDYRQYSQTMNEAASNFASKRTLEELLTKQILNVSEGKVTGIQPAFQSVVNKAASAVGVDLGKQYENLEQYDADMRRVANQMVNELLGEGSKTLSDFDRQLAQEIVGYYSGQGGYVFRDPDVLLGRLQNTLSDVQKAQATSLNTMKDITDATAGLVLQSGRPVQFRSAMSVAGPFLTETQSQNFNLVQGDDGVFRIPQ